MPTYFPTKYSSARDEAIHLITSDCQDWNGTAEAPTGAFYGTRYTRSDLVDIVVNDLDITAVRQLRQLMTDYGVKLDDLIGYWTVQETDQGFVHVNHYDDPEAQLNALDYLRDRFYDWDRQVTAETWQLYPNPTAD